MSSTVGKVPQMSMVALRMKLASSATADGMTPNCCHCSNNGRSTLGYVVGRIAATAAADWKYSSEGTKPLAEAVRARLKALQLPRYKFVVHVVVGENRGQGFKLASRCLWDAACDDLATESYTNDNVFVVATVYAVYLY